jgi:hypothetical protein
VGVAVARGRPAAGPVEGGAGARRLGLRVPGGGRVDRRLDRLPAEAAGAQRPLDATAAVEAPLGQRPRGVVGQRGVVEEAEAGRTVERRLGDVGGEASAGELPGDLVARLPARGEGAAGGLEGGLDRAYLLKRSRVRSPSLPVAPFAWLSPPPAPLSNWSHVVSLVDEMPLTLRAKSSGLLHCRSASS